MSTSIKRHSNFISQFSTEIVHVSGDINIITDTLSHLDATIFPSDVDADEPTAELEKDIELRSSPILQQSFSIGGGF